MSYHNHSSVRTLIVFAMAYAGAAVFADLNYLQLDLNCFGDPKYPDSTPMNWLLRWEKDMLVAILRSWEVEKGSQCDILHAPEYQDLIAFDNAISPERKESGVKEVTLLTHPVFMQALSRSDSHFHPTSSS